jgi:hypothetical protein
MSMIVMWAECCLLSGFDLRLQVHWNAVIGVQPAAKVYKLAFFGAEREVLFKLFFIIP